MAQQPIARFLIAACLPALLAGCALSPGQWPMSGWLGSTEKEAELSYDELKHPKKVYLAYGRWQEKIGRLAEARHAYQRILQNAPDSVEALLGLGRIDYLTGRRTRAEQRFQKAVELDPQKAKTYDSIGRFYASQKRWEKALAMLHSAVEAAPKQAGYRHHLAKVQVHAGDIEAALGQFGQTVGEAAAHYNVGYLLHQQEKTEAARRHLRQALRHQPDLKKARVMLSRLDKSQKKQAENGRPNVPQQVRREPSPQASPQRAAPTNRRFRRLSKSSGSAVPQ